MFWLQPLISAFIGWVTTWVAIKMLFHPRNPVRFLGITIQGVFPKRQKQVAEKLGAIVAKELIHFDEIAGMLKDPQQLKDRILRKAKQATENGKKPSCKTIITTKPG